MVNAIYIHIPFCKSICSYCDFCKMFYKRDWVLKYLKALECEVDKFYQNEVIKTIYIGGGSPSALGLDELKILFSILKRIKKSNVYEFTFECNLDDINEELLIFLKENGVNRLSIGVESFNDKYLKLMNRKVVNVDNKIKLCKKYFSNINVDLIYGINGESLKELDTDLNNFLALDIEHISLYALILEDNTVLKVNGYNELDSDIQRDMYEFIRKKLRDAGYIHYEVSNFAKPNYYSRHNMQYWNNDEYYGFGLGASGYVRGVRYENTRSLNHYLKEDYRLEEHCVSLRENMENEMILNLRKIRGISKKKFYDKYHREIKDVFDVSKLGENKRNYYIPKKYLFVQNSILVDFLL